MYISDWAITDHQNIVYRVNWLRAKARFDRWNEELILVPHEMQWTVLWFEYQSKVWTKRATESVGQGKEGHRAYAFKQVEMWDKFSAQGRKSFLGKMVT